MGKRQRKKWTFDESLVLTFCLVHISLFCGKARQTVNLLETLWSLGWLQVCLDVECVFYNAIYHLTHDYMENRTYWLSFNFRNKDIRGRKKKKRKSWKVIAELSIIYGVKVLFTLLLLSTPHFTIYFQRYIICNLFLCFLSCFLSLFFAR